MRTEGRETTLNAGFSQLAQASSPFAHLKLLPAVRGLASLSSMHVPIYTVLMSTWGAQNHRLAPLWKTNTLTGTCLCIVSLVVNCVAHIQKTICPSSCFLSALNHYAFVIYCLYLLLGILVLESPLTLLITYVLGLWKEKKRCIWRCYSPSISTRLSPFLHLHPVPPTLVRSQSHPFPVFSSYLSLSELSRYMVGFFFLIIIPLFFMKDSIICMKLLK